MRENLIELVHNARMNALWHNAKNPSEYIADMLIDSGVTIPVRCKDCKHYKDGELLAPNKFCFRLKHPTEDRNVGYNFGADDFCSYGERKDNDNQQKT